MTSKGNVLVVDDEAGIRQLLREELIGNGYGVECAIDGTDALPRVIPGKFRVALCDMNMPKLSGLAMLERLRERDPDLEVIMMTGFGTVEAAVEAMKKGAYHFVQKPLNVKEISALVEKSLEKSELRRTIQELRMTQRKLEEAQTQLVQSEKLAGIGQLAAGIAHELNNPLTGIVGFSQLLLGDQTVKGQHRKDIETIHTQAQRSRVIIRNLLQFSRRERVEGKPVSIEPILRSVIDLTRYEFAEAKLTIVTQFAKSLPAVKAEANQLQQVFLNIVTNARQALEEKRGVGRLTIEVGRRGKRVFIRFIDNGPGIPEEIRNKIFDPFFTTKSPGKGTGLGLSICHGILQQHHGSISVDSRAGEGATFRIELPVHEME